MITMTSAGPVHGIVPIAGALALGLALIHVVAGRLRFLAARPVAQRGGRGVCRIQSRCGPCAHVIEAVSFRP